MRLNKPEKAGLQTMKDFTRRVGKPIRQYDTSDLEQLQLQNPGSPAAVSHPAVGQGNVAPELKQLTVPAKPRRNNAVAVPAAHSSLPPHLLMASLLEQLCLMYVGDRALAQQLFKKLCEQLSKLNIIAPLSHLDEMSGLRFQHRSLLNKIMLTAIRSLKQPIRALTSSESAAVMDRLAPPDEDIISQQTSRYRNEFQEMGHLGKGGFGTVFKARHYLDGREYAVKKIKFKQKNTKKLLKLLREVKALASLQHSNIVGYNGAWMEYDSPFSSSSSCTSHTSPVTNDQSMKVSQSLSQEGRSVSIEFRSDVETADESLQPSSLLQPYETGLAMSARVFSSVQVVEDLGSSGDAPGAKFKGDKNHFKQDKKLKHNSPPTGTDVKVRLNSETLFQQEINSSADWAASSTNMPDKLSLGQGKSSQLYQEKKSKVVINQRFKHTRPLPSNSPKRQLHTFSQRESFGALNSNCSLGSSWEVASEETSFSISTQAECEASSSQYVTYQQQPIVRQASLGFKPSSSQLRRHHSHVESSRSVKITLLDDDEGSDSNNRDGCRRFGREEVERRSRHRRSMSYDAVGDVDEIMEARNHDYDFQSSITLYIQMELCGQTLQEWLVDRNLDFSSNGFESSQMLRVNMQIFRQLLEGVNFIHSCGVIHRDLKPRNIFLSSKNLHVKIGDFGLAKAEVLSTEAGDLISSPTSEDIPFVLSDSHTSGVGTSAYASPEQLLGTLYDSKSDMFSLGVILYELFHVFDTEMERVNVIEKLRDSHKCCTLFQSKWPSQAQAVQSLTSPKSNERPSAQDLLSSQLFTSQEEKIKGLELTVKQQQKEIQLLRKELATKNALLDQLQAKFPFLKTT